LSWIKEFIIVLVKAAPNWSKKHKTYEICTAGISETDGWRRLYPFPEMNMVKKGVKVWDIIQIETTTPSDDVRPESRKIKPESIVVIDHIENRKERRKILDKLSEPSLENALNEKRTLALIKPNIEGFDIKKRPRSEASYIRGQRFSPSSLR
jgi:hypothetical protein